MVLSQKLLATLALVAAVPQAHAAETVTMAADDWCPFTCDAGAKHRGYMVDVAERILKDAGYKVRYVTVSWVDALQGARAGTYDVVLGAGANEAKELVLSKATLGFNEVCVYVQDQYKWEFTGIPSLGKVRLGVVKDYAYDEHLDYYIKKHAKDPARIVAVGGKEPLDDLLAGIGSMKFDAFLEERHVVQYKTHKAPMALKVREAGCLDAGGLHAAFTLKTGRHETLAKVMDDGVKALRQSGELKKLLAPYGLGDWSR